MKPINLSEARQLIQQLNRLDLDRASYVHVQKVIQQLFVGIPIHGKTPHRDSRIYRGVKYRDKPETVRQLSYPPGDRVINFQRCNPPNAPMFYCSPDPAAVFYELNVQPGDRLYVSKWSIVDDFIILQIAPNVDDNSVNHRRDLIVTFFETRFSQPIHETYSSQYKITAAIAEHLSRGNIMNGENTNFKGVEIGALSYPSVSHPARSENIAIRPAIADRCLRLDYVEEMLVDEVIGKTIRYTRTNFASTFPEGNIAWKDTIIHWKVPPHSRVTVTAEQDGWVARDESGNIVNPG